MQQGSALRLSWGTMWELACWTKSPWYEHHFARDHWITHMGKRWLNYSLLCLVALCVYRAPIVQKELPFYCHPAIKSWIQFDSISPAMWFQGYPEKAEQEGEKEKREEKESILQRESNLGGRLKLSHWQFTANTDGYGKIHAGYPRENTTRSFNWEMIACVEWGDSLC